MRYNLINITTLSSLSFYCCRFSYGFLLENQCPKESEQKEDILFERSLLYIRDEQKLHRKVIESFILIVLRCRPNFTM